LIPERARLVTGDPEADSSDTHSVATEALRPGDVIRVLPGERVAVDGVVLEGRAAMDESVLTGESRCGRVLL
jgi:P-type E1-E2 ATPase